MKLNTNDNDGSIYENFSDMIFGLLIIFIVFVLVIVVKTKTWKPVEKTIEVVKIVEKPIEIVKYVEVIKYVEKPIEIVKYIEAKPINKSLSKRHISIEKDNGVIYINTGSVKFTPVAFNEVMKYVGGGLTYEIENYVSGNEGKVVETMLTNIQKNSQEKAVLSYKKIDKEVKLGKMIMSIDDKDKLVNDFGLNEREM